MKGNSSNFIIVNIMERIKSVCILFLLSLVISTLSSCSGDDEDGMTVGGVNLVGTWALIHQKDNKIETYVQYIIKADGKISRTTITGEYVDGYLKTKNPQFYIDSSINEAKQYQCTFKGNSIYYEDWEVAKITVIDSETVQMVSTKVGGGTLKKVKGIVSIDTNPYDDTGNNDNPTPTGDVNLAFIGNNGQAYYFNGAFIAFESTTRGVTLEKMNLLRVYDSGNITMDEIEGTFDNGILKTTCKEDYRSEPLWKVSYKDENNHLYDNLDRHILDVQCTDGNTFYMQIPYGRSYELKRVTEIIWKYDFISNNGYIPDEPFSVKEAIAKCKELGSTASENDFYVKGIISSIDEVSLSYGNATFNISDDGYEFPESTLKAYHTYAPDNKRFESESQIKVGDVVVLCGKLVNYRDNAPELLQGFIYSLSSGSSPIDFGTHGDGTTR